MWEGRKDELEAFSGGLCAAREVDYERTPPGPTSRTAN